MRARLTVIGSALALFLVGLIGTAFAVDPTTPAEVVGNAAADVKTSMFAVAVAILPYAALLFAIVLGWRWVRRFLKA